MTTVGEKDPQYDNRTGVIICSRSLKSKDTEYLTFKIFQYVVPTVLSLKNLELKSFRNTVNFSSAQLSSYILKFFYVSY